MNIIEISYTGDILAHNRCRRSWAYEKHVGMRSHEQSQALEGLLMHHSVEWLSRYYMRQNPAKHASLQEFEKRLEQYLKLLRSRGISTSFTKDIEVLNRIKDNVFPQGSLHPTVQLIVESAKHTEYELRSVKDLLPSTLATAKSKVLLRGILDVVIQHTTPMTYHYVWKPNGPNSIKGTLHQETFTAKTDDIEIWDYKGSKLSLTYLDNYILQLLTYAALYEKKTGHLPVRCVLFFVNEKTRAKQLVRVELNRDLLKLAMDWTLKQVDGIQHTIEAFQQDTHSVEGGDKCNNGTYTISKELTQQCTTCSLRFDCTSYANYIQASGGSTRDLDRLDIFKN